MLHNQRIIILIDLGASHSYIYLKLIRKIEEQGPKGMSSSISYQSKEKSYGISEIMYDCFEWIKY